MRRILFLIFSCLILAGCGEVELVKAKVIKIETANASTPSLITSGFTYYRTTIKTEDGRVDSVRMYVGKVGSEITGYWRSGNWDYSTNGFRLKD